MQLPYTAQNLIFWFDPSVKLVNQNNNAKVSSVVDKIGRRSTSQAIEAHQPTWSATVMDGQPGITFSGNQSLSADWLAQYFNDGYSQMSIICAVKIPPQGFVNSTFNSIFALSDSSESTRYIHTGTVKLAGVDYFQAERAATMDSDLYPDVAIDGSFTYDYNMVSIVKIYFDPIGSTVKIQVNNSNEAESSQTGVIGPNYTFDKFTIGAYGPAMSGLFGQGFLTGSIGQLLVYKSATISPDVEQYMKTFYGVKY